MKKRILLIDESLTVQKVVALTLDKNRYAIQYAKSRSEALKQWSEYPPDLVLVGDQGVDINIPSFPKEIEVWLGRNGRVPAMILITSQDIKEQRHYAAVLRKPFAPSALQALVQQNTTERVEIKPPMSDMDSDGSPDDFEDQRLQKIFNDTFADESNLVRETFQTEVEREEPTLVSIPSSRHIKRPPNAWDEKSDAAPLWDAPPSPPPLQSQYTRTAAQKAEDDLWGISPHARPETRETKVSVSAPEVSEKDLAQTLQSHNLDEIVDRILTRIVPPIVERLVQERLDKLLKAHEEFVELKP